MKRSKKLAKKLQSRIKQWDSFPKAVQASTTRPGSEHK
jgi:hypothetical protein